MNRINILFLTFFIVLQVKAQDRNMSIYDIDNLLGDYINIKNHPKSLGVNLKIRPPLRWTIKEGDRPHIVKKFVKGNGEFFGITITELPTFNTKDETRLLMSNVDFEQAILDEFKILDDVKVTERDLIVIDNYPALEFTLEGFYKMDGEQILLIFKFWIINYEDKSIKLTGTATDNPKNLDPVYDLIFNSIIFPDQYEEY